jgi:hypothetical protein
MAIIRALTAFLCIFILFFMGRYAGEHYDREENIFLSGLSAPNGLKGEEKTFLYKRAAETKDGDFAFYFKGKPVWVRPPEQKTIKRGDMVSLYGRFGEENIFYAEGCRLEKEKLRILKKAVSFFGCLIAFLFFLRSYRFNLRLFHWEPRENA